MLEEPRTVSLMHPSAGRLDVKVGKFDLQVGLAGMLRGPDSFAVLPDVVARVERGDWLPLALASSQYRSGEGIHGMKVAMDCASGADKAWNDRIAKGTDHVPGGLADL